MTIAVVGATGRTGREVVKQALNRGHAVKAIARRPDEIKIQHGGLTLESADVLDQDRVIAALTGCDSVISALGIGASRKPTVIYSQGVENELVGMDKNGIGKIAVISAVPVGSKKGLPFMARRVGIPILRTLFGPTYVDMRLMEDKLQVSQVDWTVLRPGRLIAKHAKGEYRLDTDTLPSKGQSITCADLATALLDAVDHDDLRRKIAYVAN